MLRMRFALLISSFLLSSFQCSGQIEHLGSLYKHLTQPDAGTIPDPTSLSAMAAADMPRVTTAELRTIVPTIQKCLESGNPKVRTLASMFLIVLGTRPDSADALEPYDGHLIASLDEAEVKTSAIYLLGNEYPRPSPRALHALYAHVNDENNTAEEFRALAGTLIRASAADPSVIHALIASAKKRSQAEHANEAIIEGIALEATNVRIADNDEAIEFIRAGFRDPSDRFSSVQAALHLPKGARDRLAVELERIAEDPAELPRTRSAARAALTEP